MRHDHPTIIPRLVGVGVMQQKLRLQLWVAQDPAQGAQHALGNDGVDGLLCLFPLLQTLCANPFPGPPPVHLLLQGPLCVCHFQKVLGEPQVKISKHLGYLKARGLVTASRQGNWMIYALPPEAQRSPELAANLACLQDCAAQNPLFKRDLGRLAKLDHGCGPLAPKVNGLVRSSCGCP